MPRWNTVALSPEDPRREIGVTELHELDAGWYLSQIVQRPGGPPVVVISVTLKDKTVDDGKRIAERLLAEMLKP